MEPLPDGRYDVLVVGTGEGDDGETRVEITFTTGELKGSTLILRTSLSGDRALDMLGLPATLHVAEGVPRLVLD